MPTFVCEKCGCIDNSACGGTYWGRYTPDIYPADYNGELLCCVCAPLKLADGSKNGNAGKWHNKFKRIKGGQENKCS